MFTYHVHIICASMSVHVCEYVYDYMYIFDTYLCACIYTCVCII